MATPSLVRQSLRPQLYICGRCIARIDFLRISRRAISQPTIDKFSQAESEAQWIERRRHIISGRRQSMLSLLEDRGYIKAIAGGRDPLDKLITDKRVGAYVGIDPTAPSMHVGHLLPFMALFWMYIHGYHTVLILGGDTSSIGDPSGRTTARATMSSDVWESNITLMHSQLERLWLNVEKIAGRHGYHGDMAWRRQLLNNHEWLRDLGLLEFLRKAGTGVRLGPMLSRDFVKTRLEGDGMALSEFLYPLLQAWDWWHLYRNEGVQIQIGGSDQFGNIISGIETINYIRKTHCREEGDDPLMVPMGFTVPLLTTSSGEKFGKSSGNAVWLDEKMTSVFDLYGFFVKTADADVERYLKLLTFLPLSTINSTMQEHAKDPSQRIAQHLLAFEFVSLAHSLEKAKEAEQQHRAVFSKEHSLSSIIKSLARGSSPEVLTAPESPGREHVEQMDAPNFIILPQSQVKAQSFPSVLWSAGLVGSKSEGHRLLRSKGAYIGLPKGDRVEWIPIPEKESPDKYILDDGLLVLRIGKKNVRVCRVVSDKE